MNLNNFFNNSMTKKFFCTLKNGHFAPGNQLFKMAIFRALLNYLRALLNFYARKNLKKNSSIVDQCILHSKNYQSRYIKTNFVFIEKCAMIA